MSSFYCLSLNQINITDVQLPYHINGEIHCQYIQVPLMKNVDKTNHKQLHTKWNISYIYF